MTGRHESKSTNQVNSLSLSLFLSLSLSLSLSLPPVTCGSDRSTGSVRLTFFTLIQQAACLLFGL